MLHIIHPYTFKLIGHDLYSGPIDEYHERDSRLSNLVKTALSSFYPVFVHEKSGRKSMCESASLHNDSLFHPFFNPGVNWVRTDNSGLPILPKKEGDKQYEDSDNLDTITHTQLVDLIGSPDEILVCGGEFIRCERNFMEYIDKFYSKFERRFYIPEFSVVIKEDIHLKEETTEDLKLFGFNPVSYEQSLEIIKHPCFSEIS